MCLCFCKVIAVTVRSDPVKYSEAFLGKPNEQYCSWILDSEKWGGQFSLFFSFIKEACFSIAIELLYL